MVLLKFKELKDPSAERGIWAHEFLEQYVRHLLDIQKGQEISFGETLFDELWRSHPMPPESKAELYDLTVGYIRQAQFDIERVVEPEMSVNLDWNLRTLDDPFDKRIWFRARMDLLSLIGDEVALVEDYKTSWRIKSETELRDDRQALIYAWVAFYLFDSVEQVKIRFRYVRYKKASEVTFNRTDTDHIERMLREVSDQIEQRVSMNEPPEKAWPAIPGEVCTFCPVQCPLIRNLVDSDQLVTTQDQANQLAQEYVALDRAYEKHKKLLKAWVDERGPIEVNGKSVGYYVEERKKYPSKMIIDTLMGMGHDVEGLFNLTSDGVKQFIKSHPETAALFSQFSEDKSQTKFMIGDVNGVITDVTQQPKAKKSKKKGIETDATEQQSLTIS
jgi:hypothetical protein